MVIISNVYTVMQLFRNSPRTIESIIWVACKALCVDFLSSVSSFSSQKTHGELKEKNSFFVPNVLLFPSVFIKKTAILKITRAEWIVNGEFIDKYISR